MTSVSYQSKLSLLTTLYPNMACVSIPQAAKAIGVDEDTLRSDPSLKVMIIGTRRKVALDSLAKWMDEREQHK